MFLLSDEASFTTGAELFVDAGMGQVLQRLLGEPRAIWNGISEWQLVADADVQTPIVGRRILVDSCHPLRDDPFPAIRLPLGDR